jgi:hypothetical protein
VAQGARCDGSWSRFPATYGTSSGVSFFSSDMVDAAAAAAVAWCDSSGNA